MNDNTTKTCTNCKYFQRYYVIGCDYALKDTSLGRCINSDVAKSISTKRVKKDVGCDLWQPYELQKLKIQYEAEAWLQFYCRKANKLLDVLLNIEHL